MPGTEYEKQNMAAGQTAYRQQYFQTLKLFIVHLLWNHVVALAVILDEGSLRHILSHRRPFNLSVNDSIRNGADMSKAGPT